MFEVELKRLCAHFSGGFENPCEAKHGRHETTVLDRMGQSFHVFDWKAYANTEGYCPADDAVSQTIEVGGGWESHVTKVADKILAQTDQNAEIVIDVGAHVGWYSVLAANYGWLTLAVEANLDCCELLELNLSASEGFADEWAIAHGWIDESTRTWYDETPIHLIKVDIEGNEQHVYRVFADQFHKNLIDYAIFEISPVFNDSYDALIHSLLEDGYRGFRIDQHGDHTEWTENDVMTKLKEFPQIDMCFVAPGKSLPW